MKRLSYEKFNRKMKLTLSAGLFLCFVGCAIQQDAPKMKYYTLNYSAPDPVSNPDKRAFLHVKRLTAAAPYNSTRIVYSENEYEFSNYVYHHWMTDPSEMLTSQLVRDLREADIARAVVKTPGNGKVTHVIEGAIEKFYEFDGSPRWNAVLSLTLTLMKNESGGRSPSLVFQKTYDATEELEKNNPLGLARAMSDAMKAVSSEFIADVADNLQ